MQASPSPNHGHRRAEGVSTWDVVTLTTTLITLLYIKGAQWSGGFAYQPRGVTGVARGMWGWYRAFGQSLFIWIIPVTLAVSALAWVAFRRRWRPKMPAGLLPLKGRWARLFFYSLCLGGSLFWCGPIGAMAYGLMWIHLMVPVFIIGAVMERSEGQLED